MSRPFAVIGFTVFFTIAVLFNYETGVTVTALLLFTVALVVALLFKSLRKSPVVICSIISVILACILLLSSVEFLYKPAVAFKDKTCDISAVLISEPEYQYGNYYYVSKVTLIDSQPVDLKVRLSFNSALDADSYDVVKGKFTFYVPGSSNDIFLSSNKANGVFLGAYSSDDEYEIMYISETNKPFGKTVSDLRIKIKDAVYRILPNESGALAVALLIGNKSGLLADILNKFSFIGITHIICVSGYHLSLWSMLVYELLRKTKLNSRISSLICIIPVVFMMLVSGMTYSVMRAGIMMIIYLLSNVLSRKRDSLNSLGFALMIITVFNPFASGSASLQLSALSTAGIVLYSEYAAPETEKYFKKIKVDMLRHFVNRVVSIFMITFSATAFTLPVCLYLYNRFNFMVFVANMVVVPISGICMVLCAAGAVVGCFTTNIINIPAYIGGLFAKFIIYFSEAIAEIKFLSFSVERDETSIIIISLFLICVLSLVLSYFGKSFPRLTTVLCSSVFVVLLVFNSLSDKKITKICVADCGNGTSVIMSKGDETLLIGCGGTEFSGTQEVCQSVTKTDNNLQALIFPGFDDYSSSYFIGVAKELQPCETYCDEIPSDIIPVVSDSELKSFVNLRKSEHFNICTETINGKSVFFAENEDLKILVLYDNFKNINELPSALQKADIIITRNDYPAGLEETGAVLVVVNAENSRGMIIQNELNNIGLNCTATAGCGNIIIKADKGDISSYREA